MGGDPIETRHALSMEQSLKELQDKIEEYRRELATVRDVFDFSWRVLDLQLIYRLTSYKMMADRPTLPCYSQGEPPLR